MVDILLTFRFLLTFGFEGDPGLAAAFEAGDDNVGFPPWLQSNAAGFSRNQQRVAAFADAAFVNRWNAQTRGHADFLSCQHVALRQFRASFVVACCLFEEDVYADSGYLLCGRIHSNSPLLMQIEYSWVLLLITLFVRPAPSPFNKAIFQSAQLPISAVGNADKNKKREIKS